MAQFYAAHPSTSMPRPATGRCTDRSRLKDVYLYPLQCNYQTTLTTPQDTWTATVPTEDGIGPTPLVALG